MDANPAKSTEIEAPILEVIRNRRSKRAFSDKAVSHETIQALFEAARWAPSSVNEQPWTYIYATKDQPDLWQKIFDALNDSNKIWAQHAPLLILSLAKKNFSRNERPNGSAKYDLGAANAFLSLQATDLGLIVHQMGGYDQERARVALNIPETFDLAVIMAVGYPGDPNELPEHLKLRELAPRERYVQHAFAMNRSF